MTTCGNRPQSSKQGNEGNASWRYMLSGGFWSFATFCKVLLLVRRPWTVDQSIWNVILAGTFTFTLNGDITGVMYFISCPVDCSCFVRSPALLPSTFKTTNTDFHHCSSPDHMAWKPSGVRIHPATPTQNEALRTPPTWPLTWGSERQEEGSSWLDTGLMDMFELSGINHGTTRNDTAA